MPKKGKYISFGPIILQQLLENTVTQGECMLWKGAKSTAGYPFCSAWGKQWNTHRLILYITTGWMPLGRDHKTVVMHSCDRPSCINPKHLSWGTQKENIQDAIAKGRYRHHIGERNYGAKLTLEQVQEIRDIFSQGNHYGLTAELSERYGVHRTTIQRIRLNLKWKE